MRHRESRLRAALVMTAVLGLAAAPAEAQLKVGSLAAGLGAESMSRTVVWGDDAAPAKLTAVLFGARAELGFGRGIVIGLSAGLSLSGVSALTFGSLPVSLQYDGPRLRGLSLGADATVPLRRWSSIEIGAAGRIVYSLGLKASWPLEGFAVEGEASGTLGWLEAAVGPRIAYRALDKITPYLEVTVRWLHAGFEMNETLADLVGRETKTVDAFSVGAALGADADLGARLALRAKAGLTPYAQGVDGLVSVGLIYKF